MKALAVLTAFCFASLVYVSNASAHEDFKNLKILDGADKKAVEKGMKSLSKGLGVKCKSCHVKGEFESDKVPAKGAARKFFTAVVGEKDQAKKDAALKELLKALKLDKAKKPGKIWEGLAKFKKKK